MNEQQACNKPATKNKKETDETLAQLKDDVLGLSRLIYEIVILFDIKKDQAVRRSTARKYAKYALETRVRLKLIDANLAKLYNSPSVDNYLDELDVAYKMFEKFSDVYTATEDMTEAQILMFLEKQS